MCYEGTIDVGTTKASQITFKVTEREQVCMGRERHHMHLSISNYSMEILSYHLL